MTPYVHKVQYYETDKMGITHHSNYVRWMEEARIAFLNEIGMQYEKMEAQGIVSPVTAIECKFRATTTFPDEITVRARVAEFKGIVLKFRYEMTNQRGERVFEGRSEHCFLRSDGRIMRLDKEQPEIYELLKSLAEAE